MNYRGYQEHCDLSADKEKLAMLTHKHGLDDLRLHAGAPQLHGGGAHSGV